MPKEDHWLELALELQSIAQAGLYYTKDIFDRERFTRVREIAAELIAGRMDISASKAAEVFCCETGYQTPKIDTRAVIVKDGKILLVRENNGTWSLPGGWEEPTLSVGENVVKEAREEAGLDVIPQRILAFHDRRKHNPQVYPFRICAVYVLCTVQGGSFEENDETTAAAYFSPDALPTLALEKNTPEQIALCMTAAADENWKTVFD